MSGYQRIAVGASPYTIRRVDEDDQADDLKRLHDETWLTVAGYADAEWWFAFFEGHPIAYCGLCPASFDGKPTPGIAYLCRVGVLEAHRGNRLQARLMRAAERYARRNGFTEIISDTNNVNAPSAMNFVRCGYAIFDPVKAGMTPWNPPSIYWRKRL